MPALKSAASATVLLTGVNGFLGAHIAQSLLESGYSVRGVVRSADKGEYLSKLFSCYGSKLQFTIVKDITAEGAFDEAVKDVDAIIHSASPYHVHADHPDEIIIPAVKGTTSILGSAIKYGSAVKRIVITSSTVSVNNPPSKPTIFSEVDWNEAALVNIEKLGRDASNLEKYCASKTLAEKAAWKLYEDNKSTIGWDLTVLAPPFIFGPVIHEVESVEKLNTSMLHWHELVLKGSSDENDSLANNGLTWVDVRDLALTHVRALMNKVGGERVIISTAAYKDQDWITAANEVGRSIYPEIRPGNTKYDAKKAVHLVDFDSSKKERIFGTKWTTINETTQAILENFKQRGF